MTFTRVEAKWLSS